MAFTNARRHWPRRVLRLYAGMPHVAVVCGFKHNWMSLESFAVYAEWVLCSTGVTFIKVPIHREPTATQLAASARSRAIPCKDPLFCLCAVNEGKAVGLDRRCVSKFFTAQIEANKLVQVQVYLSYSERVP